MTPATAVTGSAVESIKWARRKADREKKQKKHKVTSTVLLRYQYPLWTSLPCVFNLIMQQKRVNILRISNKNKETLVLMCVQDLIFMKKKIQFKLTKTCKKTDNVQYANIVTLHLLQNGTNDHGNNEPWISQVQSKNKNNKKKFVGHS